MSTTTAPNRARRPIRLAARLDPWKTAIAGTGGGALAAFLAPRFFTTAAANGWEAASVYSSVFGVFSILTGLLFAFYGIVVSSENDFMKQLRRSNVKAYATFRHELKAAIGFGALVTLCCIPLEVVEPAPTRLLSWSGATVVAWAGATTAGSYLFWRVATIFFELVDHVPARPPLAN